jgi:hypothetical protein
MYSVATERRGYEAEWVTEPRGYVDDAVIVRLDYETTMNSES